MKVKIAIIGEFKNSSVPQIALNKALENIDEDMNINLTYDWIDTEEINHNADDILCKYNGIWSAPGSPFKSLGGILKAIQFAREKNIPHLGTCAGFQHSVIEIARNVIGIKDAQHEEYDSNADNLFISRLACSLAGKKMEIKIKEGTKAYNCYKRSIVEEDYYCNFGINPAFRERLETGGIQISGVDQDDEIRIIELPENDFFMATLFVPQTRSEKGNPHPIIKRFIEKAFTRVEQKV